MTPVTTADIHYVMSELFYLGVYPYFDVFENRGLFGDDVFASSLVLVRRDVPWVRVPLIDRSALKALVEDSFAQHPKQSL